MRGFVGPIRLAVALIAFAAAGGVGIGAAAAASPAPPNRIGAVEWGAPRAQVTCTANVPTGVHFDFSYDASDLDRGGKAPYDPVADVELQPAGGAPAVQLGHEPVGVRAGRSGAYSKDITLTAAPGADATVELSVYLPSDASYHFIDQQVALTCPPPSAARPVLPEVDLMLTGTGTCDAPRFDIALVVDASKATQPWTMVVYRIDKAAPQQVVPIHPGTSKNVTVARNSADVWAFDVEVAFVGPARVDIGQVFNLAPLSCPPPLAALDSDQVVPGGTDRLSVRGFSPHQSINVTLHPAAQFKLARTLGTIRTDAIGTGQLTFTVPASTALGHYVVVATNSAGRVAEADLQVVAAPVQPTPPSLAETGTHAAGLAALGFVLILSGGAMLVLARRRRTTY